MAATVTKSKPQNGSSTSSSQAEGPPGSDFEMSGSPRKNGTQTINAQPEPPEKFNRNDISQDPQVPVNRLGLTNDNDLIYYTF